MAIYLPQVFSRCVKTASSTLSLVSCAVDNTRIAALNLLVTHVDYVMTSCVKSLRGGVLYDLRSRHPTIDGVGLLNEEKTLIPWLVFIQISLSAYDEHHSKLSDLLTLPSKKPKELKGPCQRTLYSYYKQLAGTEVKNVIFVYISPEEMDSDGSNDILPNLHKSLSKTKNNMHFGILSQKSYFHPAICKCKFQQS